jgi:hypothetical protein
LTNEYRRGTSINIIRKITQRSKRIARKTLGEEEMNRDETMTSKIVTTIHITLTTNINKKYFQVLCLISFQLPLKDIFGK